jgi:hypothetical protein
MVLKYSRAKRSKTKTKTLAHETKTKTCQMGLETKTCLETSHHCQ